MKTELLECVSQGELRRMLVELIVKCGGQGKAAKKIGVSQAAISQFLSGYGSLGRKAMVIFGVERRTVYVLKNKESKSDNE